MRATCCFNTEGAEDSEKSCRGAARCAPACPAVSAPIRKESKFGGFGEVEIMNFHGWDDHFEGFFGGGADGRRHGFDVLEKLDERLVKPEIADGPGDFAVFDQE